MVLPGFWGIAAEADAETVHCLKRIQDAAAHMGRLLEGLLNLAKLGRQGLRLQLTSLHSLVADVVERIKLDTRDRQIEWILGDLPHIQCDPVLMEAVFTNLLSNAAKFTGLRECAIVRVGQRLENGETVIFVADNGVGFNMKYADKLFGIFQRLHRAEDFSGTGVGLATAQRIVQKHGGRIWAEAEVNTGATFCFTVASPVEKTAEQRNQDTEVIHA
jgi:chemotaxis family two-component system sensor kinase Cph1